jgi:hypothetical protein
MEKELLWKVFRNSTLWHSACLEAFEGDVDDLIENILFARLSPPKQDRCKTGVEKVTITPIPKQELIPLDEKGLEEFIDNNTHCYCCGGDYCKETALEGGEAIAKAIVQRFGVKPDKQELDKEKLYKIADNWVSKAVFIEEICATFSLPSKQECQHEWEHRTDYSTHMSLRSYFVCKKCGHNTMDDYHTEIEKRRK